MASTNSNSKPRPTLPRNRPTTLIDMMHFVSNWFDCEEILVDEIIESENIAKNEEDGRLLCDCKEIWMDESIESEKIKRIESELCKNEIGDDVFCDDLGDRVANCGNRVQEKLVDCLNVVKNVEENVKIESSISGNLWITVDDLKMGNFDRETQLHVFDQLSSKVAAVVPCGSNPGQFKEQLWFNSKENRSMARFIAYTLCATDETLHDAKWILIDQEQKTRTRVSIGGGIGSISDIVDAAQMICEKRLRQLNSFFIPRILINMVFGHISMKYGFQGPNHAAVTTCALGHILLDMQVLLFVRLQLHLQQLTLAWKMRIKHLAKLLVHYAWDSRMSRPKGQGDANGK